MLPAVFDVFKTTDYVFLQIERGTVAGDMIVAQTAANGVFKLRTGMNNDGRQETRESDATLHIRPSESFITANDGNLNGHGIRVEGKDYEVLGTTGGDNFDSGVREHYRVTLKATDFSDFSEGS